MQNLSLSLDSKAYLPNTSLYILPLHFHLTNAQQKSSKFIGYIFIFRSSDVMVISLTFYLIEIKESVLSLDSISTFAHFAESSFAKPDTGTPSILFNSSATLIAVIFLFQSGTLYPSFTNLFYLVWIITINLF